MPKQTDKAQQIIEGLDQLTLLEAAELVKLLESAWGVSAAAPVAIAGGPAAPAAAPGQEEQTEFDVVLKAVGDNKINVLMVIRALTNLGLKEAKDLIERAPATVLTAVSKEAAQEAKVMMETEGAVVDTPAVGSLKPANTGTPVAVVPEVKEPIIVSVASVVAERTTENRSKEKVVHLEVVLDANYEEFNQNDLQDVIREIALQASLNVEDILVVKLKPGSIHLRLELPEDGAERFVSNWLNKDIGLKQYKITKLEIHQISEESSRNDLSARILFLASNPTDLARLRFDKEYRAIKEILERSKYGKNFQIQASLAVRIGDLQSLLLEFKPSIVHFSGHGNPTNELMFEDILGNGQPVAMPAVGKLFSYFQSHVQCIVLNTCYSKSQAEILSKYVDHVIGITDVIEDTLAIAFASSFYQALGFGKDVKTAFELGCLGIELEDRNDQNKTSVRSSSSEMVLFHKGIQAGSQSIPSKESFSIINPLLMTEQNPNLAAIISKTTQS